MRRSHDGHAARVPHGGGLFGAVRHAGVRGAVPREPPGDDGGPAERDGGGLPADEGEVRAPEEDPGAVVHDGRAVQLPAEGGADQPLPGDEGAGLRQRVVPAGHRGGLSGEAGLHGGGDEEGDGGTGEAGRGEDGRVGEAA